MGATSARAVDVRDMLCAQALAVVASALEGLVPGTGVDVLYNAEDVKHDLIVWGQDRGHLVEVTGPARLAIQRS